jgi:hypothetical protein
MCRDNSEIRRFQKKVPVAIYCQLIRSKSKKIIGIENLLVCT